MTAAPLLALEAARTGYGHLPILHGVDFAVAEGESVALLGRNGMGKTTLLKLAAGWLPLWGGTRLWRGRDAGSWPARRLAENGALLIPEDRGIFAQLSVRENLALGARAKGRSGRRARPRAAAREMTEQILKRFPELADKLENSGDSLSGGERQILSVARGLLADPALLLLDETTEGLSPQMAERIWGLLAELRNAGHALVIVDKNWQRAAALSDRCIFLVKGEIAQLLTGDELLRRPEIAERHLGI